MEFRNPLTMKVKLIILLFCCCSYTEILAQSLSPYEVQRQKVNQLLVERSNKFSQYDKSLAARTGIFGLQTKKDIKNSNEILREIVLNDNAIFRELKVLLDYKDLVTQEISQAANTKEDRIKDYKKSIKKLQDQNELLKIKLEKTESGETFQFILIILLIVALLGLSVLFYKTKNLLKQNN